MSLDTKSVMSSAISVTGTESFSDNESTVSAGEYKTSIAPGNAGSNLFDLGDGDFHIVMNGTTLETHKFLVKRFAALKDRIKDNSVTLEPGEPGIETFRDALSILYASVVDGPFDFDHTTLTSALLLATRYDYPSLRTFAIAKLENAKLCAVERIRLAREFDIPSWEEPAYLELCERDEAITMSEARVLGLETVVQMGRIREKEQRRRGKEVDGPMETKVEISDGQAGGTRVLDAAAAPTKAEPTVLATTLVKLGKAKETEPGITPEDDVTTFKPGFTGYPERSPRDLMSSYCYGDVKRDKIELNVIDCECSVISSGGKETACQCKLPPCAVSAFKQLQVQQIAHRNNMAALKATIEEVQIATSKPKATAEHAAPVLTPHTQSGTLQDDVRRWLLCRK